MNPIAIAVVLLGQYHGPSQGMAFKPHKYKDAAARKIATQALRVYNSIPSFEGFLNETHVWLNKPKIRVDLANQGWAYDGKTVWFKGQKAYHPKSTNLGPSLKEIHKRRYPMDTFVTAFAEQRNYFEDFLRPGATVSSQGKVKVNGVKCRALLVSGKGVKIHLLVRDTDHLLARSTVELLDPRGRIMSFSDKTYRYVSVGRAFPAQQFELP